MKVLVETGRADDRVTTRHVLSCSSFDQQNRTPAKDALLVAGGTPTRRWRTRCDFVRAHDDQVDLLRRGGFHDLAGWLADTDRHADAHAPGSESSGDAPQPSCRDPF